MRGETVPARNPCTIPPQSSVPTLQEIEMWLRAVSQHVGIRVLGSFLHHTGIEQHDFIHVKLDRLRAVGTDEEENVIDYVAGGEG